MEENILYRLFIYSLPFLKFCIFMQLTHWVCHWYFSVNTKINASDTAKNSNNVIIMGAGFSGLGIGVLLKMAGISFTILEKASSVGM